MTNPVLEALINLIILEYPDIEYNISTNGLSAVFHRPKLDYRYYYKFYLYNKIDHVEVRIEVNSRYRDVAYVPPEKEFSTRCMTSVNIDDLEFTENVMAVFKQCYED